MILMLMVFGLSCFTTNGQQTQKRVQSNIQFKVKNAEVQVTGDFKDMETEVDFDKGHPEKSNFHTLIDVNSIHTGIRLRDKHLKSKFYFDVVHFPTIEVHSTHVKALGEGYYNGRFKVRIKGIEKEIELPYMVTEQDGKQVFSARFNLNRRDFNLGGRSWTMANNIEVTVQFTVGTEVKN